MTNHTSTTAKLKSKRKWIIIAAAIFVALWIIGIIGSPPADETTAEPDTQPSETVEAQEAPEPEEAEPVEQEPEPTEEPEPDTPEEAIAQASGDNQATVDIGPGETGDIIFVQFDIEDLVTNGATTRGAQESTVNILEATHDSGIDYHRIFVQGHFPLGNDPEPAMILNAGYDADTVADIDFDNINPDTIFDMRDAGMVHQELED